MKISSRKLAFLVLFVGLTVLPSAALASLPGADLFTPDLSLVSDMVSPIFMIINWGLGGYGLWLIVSSVWSLLKIAAAFFSGTSMEGGKDKLRGVVIGIGLVLITITGAWYQFLIALWARISPKLDEVSALDPDTLLAILSETTKWFS